MKQEDILSIEYDLAFIVAMEEEVACLLLQDPNNEKREVSEILNGALRIGNARFINFNLTTKVQGQQVLLKCLACLSGIGKVNAAAATTILLTHFKVNIPINMGLCGSVQKVPTGTVFIGESVSYGDVDVTGFGYKFGEVPGEGKVAYYTPPKFTHRIYDLNKDKFVYIEMGRIITTDMFINDSKVKNAILDKVAAVKESEGNQLPILAFDMEAAAIAQVASQFDKRVFFFKEVSDNADESGSSDFADSAYTNTSSTLQTTVSLIMGSLETFAIGIAIKRSKEDGYTS